MDFVVLHIDVVIVKRFWSVGVLVNVAFWVNKPLLDTRNEEQTKDVRMYTWRIYSSRCSHIAVQVGTEYALEML